VTHKSRRKAKRKGHTKNKYLFGPYARSLDQELIALGFE